MTAVQKYIEACDEDITVTNCAVTQLGYLLTFEYEEEEFEELIQSKADIEDLVKRLRG